MCLYRHYSFSHCRSHRGSSDRQRMARRRRAQTGTVHGISGPFSLSTGCFISTILTKEPHLSHHRPGTFKFLPGRFDPSDHTIPTNNPLSTGLYCNHQDLSEQYSSLLLGITNTAGALTGVLGACFVPVDKTEKTFVWAGVATTGALLDRTRSWTVALFLPSIFFFLTGSVIFTLFGSGEAADLSNNAPFAIEKLSKRFR